MNRPPLSGRSYFRRCLVGLISVSNSLRQASPWAEASLVFFEDFRELSERSSFATTELRPGHVEMSNPVCGDLVRVGLRIREGKVGDFQYQQQGCWPVTGCLELLGRLVQDAPLEWVLTFSLDEFLSMVDSVPAGKRHAFSLTHRALLAATALALEGVSDEGTG